jgi:putative effector of murein hydrolase
MQPTNNQKLTGGWKLIIASLSVTSIVGMINLFSTKDVKTVNSQVINSILDKPVPTLVPVVVNGSNPVPAAVAAPTAALREVSQIAPSPTPVKQTPVIQKVGGGTSGSSTSTSSSKK